MRRTTITIAGLLAALAGFALFTVALAQGSDGPAEYQADVSYRLTTGLAEGKLVFIGQGGDIDGDVNPTLTAEPGDVVAVTLVNGDGVQHDVKFEGFANAQSDMVTTQGASSTFVFRANEEGAFEYYCTVPGHREAGMLGEFVVGERGEAEAEAESVVRAPSDLPGPIAERDEPVHHDVTLTTIEKQGRLADGTSYRYWTFDGQVPGPFLRIRQNDTVTVTLENPEDSTMVHSVDFHAVTGPGGGAVATQTAPGDANSFDFQALQPGLYVYHCATPMVAHHISNGMYGLILVEPEEGLAEVDHEYYVMQGELYTEQAFGQKGELDFNVDKLLHENPEYYVFNGSVGALTGETALTAETGDSVRIFFGVGGPNKTSSFHVIGEIFERVYDQASLTSPPLTDVQTTTVAPGGATMVEFDVEVPGTYILVDHALSRAERGLAGHLIVSGEDAPGIYNGDATEGSGH